MCLVAHLLGAPVAFGARGCGLERRNRTLAPLITYGWTPADHSNNSALFNWIPAPLTHLRPPDNKPLQRISDSSVHDCNVMYQEANSQPMFCCTFDLQQVLCFIELEHLMVRGATNLTSQHSTAQHDMSAEHQIRGQQRKAQHCCACTVRLRAPGTHASWPPLLSSSNIRLCCALPPQPQLIMMQRQANNKQTNSSMRTARR